MTEATHEPTAPSEPASSPPDPAASDAQPVARIAFLGAKGGCGTSTLAANVAAVAARHGQVCLADLDFCRGDLSAILDVTPANHIAQLVSLSDTIDEVALTGASVPHVGGFRAICQPLDLHQLTIPDAEGTRRFFEVALPLWDRLLLDLGSRIDVPTLTTLVDVERIVLVTSNLVLDLWNARRILDLLDEVKVPTERVRLVINPWSPSEVTLEEIEQNLSLPVSAVVRRDDPTLTACRLHGRLATEAFPDSRYATDVERVWDAIRDAPVPLSLPPRPFWPWQR